MTLFPGGTIPAPILLFDDYLLHDLLRSQLEQAVEAIREFSPSQLRQSTLPEIEADLIARFDVLPVELIEGAISAAVDEVQVEQNYYLGTDRSRRGGPSSIPGIRVVFSVPFKGDKELLRCRVSNFSLNPPSVILHPSSMEFVLERAGTDFKAIKESFDRLLVTVRENINGVNGQLGEFRQTLSWRVHKDLEQRYDRLHEVDTGSAVLGFPVTVRAPTPAANVKQSPPESSSRNSNEKFDVALSFAGEDRPYVKKVFEQLQLLEVSCFYDEFEKVELWGKNLIDHLSVIYKDRSRFVVMFISRFYVSKVWPTLERKNAQARALVANEEYILPTRFDDSVVPGLTDTVAYVDLRSTSPQELAVMISQKVKGL
jgi:hypothetical protein